MSTDNHAPPLKELLSGAQLPGLPQSAIRLLELSQDPENGPPEFAVPIESDPGLTGQVLRFVNSSYFGFSREISSVRLAITLVGVRTIKNFALWSAVFSLMPNPRCGPFDLKSLWQDSLRRGVLARLLGKTLGLQQAEDLFAAALLQDMAIPLLAKELPEQYVNLLECRGGGNRRLSELEKEAFGWTHADAGAFIASNWRLPESFADLVGCHADERSLSPDAEPGRLAIALSALLPAANDEHWYERELFEQTYGAIRSHSTPTVVEILTETDQGFTEFAPILKLTSPAKSLLDWFGRERADGRSVIRPDLSVRQNVDQPSNSAATLSDRSSSWRYSLPCRPARHH